jgi:hypothetical protein
MDRIYWRSAMVTVAVLLGTRLVAAEVAQPAGAAASRPSASSQAPPATSSGKRLHQGFFLRLTLGPAYLHESWNPSGGSPGASYGGFGTSIETSVGHSVLRPGLIVGGKWQLAAVVDPNESYLGATYVATTTARFLDVFAAFIDDYPNVRGGFHFGGSIGLLAATDLDAVYANTFTSWGAALSAHVGYEAFFSRRWSGGVIAQLSVYRYSTKEAAVSSTSDGLLPTLALAFTYN